MGFQERMPVSLSRSDHVHFFLLTTCNNMCPAQVIPFHLVAMLKIYVKMGFMGKRRKALGVILIVKPTFNKMCSGTDHSYPLSWVS